MSTTHAATSDRPSNEMIQLYIRKMMEYHNPVSKTSLFTEEAQLIEQLENLKAIPEALPSSLYDQARLVYEIAGSIRNVRTVLNTAYMGKIEEIARVANLIRTKHYYA